MSQLKCISGEELSYLATTAAIAISKEFDNDDLNILCNFFNTIGSVLGIISAQQAACGSKDTALTNSTPVSGRGL